MFEIMSSDMVTKHRAGIQNPESSLSARSPKWDEHVFNRKYVRDQFSGTESWQATVPGQNLISLFAFHCIYFYLK